MLFIWHHECMTHVSPVENLDVERLLADWRWLCPQEANADQQKCIRRHVSARSRRQGLLKLDVAVGRLSLIADCEAQFLSLSSAPDNVEEWFAKSDERAAAERGLIPGPNQCIGFSVPLIFAEGGSLETAYLADIYDHVGFLGDLHRQITTMPDGAKVRLRVSD